MREIVYADDVIKTKVTQSTCDASDDVVETKVIKLKSLVSTAGD